MAETPGPKFLTRDEILPEISISTRGPDAERIRDKAARVLATVPCPDLLLLLDHSLFVVNGPNAVERISPAVVAGRSVFVIASNLLDLPEVMLEHAVLKLSAWCVLKARHKYEQPPEMRDPSAWYDEEKGNVIRPEFEQETRRWNGVDVQLGDDLFEGAHDEAEVLVRVWRQAWERHQEGQRPG